MSNIRSAVRPPFSPLPRMFTYIIIIIIILIPPPSFPNRDIRRYEYSNSLRIHSAAAQPAKSTDSLAGAEREAGGYGAPRWAGLGC